jgi:hypothetical protein
MDDGPNWVATSIVIGVANIGIILVVIGVYFLMRRKPASPEFSLE